MVNLNFISMAFHHSLFYVNLKFIYMALRKPLFYVFVVFYGNPLYIFPLQPSTSSQPLPEELPTEEEEEDDEVEAVGTKRAPAGGTGPPAKATRRSQPTPSVVSAVSRERIGLIFGRVIVHLTRYMYSIQREVGRRQPYLRSKLAWY